LNHQDTKSTKVFIVLYHREHREHEEHRVSYCFAFCVWVEDETSVMSDMEGHRPGHITGYTVVLSSKFAGRAYFPAMYTELKKLSTSLGNGE
jgi:hypothetical protein